MRKFRWRTRNPWKETRSKGYAQEYNWRSQFIGEAVEEGHTSPIIAWRAWKIQPDGDGSVDLTSVWLGLPWTNDMGMMKAAHLSNKTSSDDHLAPQMNCQCGFWGVIDLPTLWQTLGWANGDIVRASLETRTLAIGRVSLWGRVIVGTHGWRAQFAYPYDVWAPKYAQDSIRSKYKIDVFDFDELWGKKGDL